MRFALFALCCAAAFGQDPISAHSIKLVALANPSAPTVARTCPTAPINCGKQYAYAVVAKLADGTTTAVSASSALERNSATLDSTHYNLISWTSVAGADNYDVYCTVGCSSVGTVAVGVRGTRYVDSTGFVTTATAPTTNTTGGIKFPDGSTQSSAAPSSMVDDGTTISTTRNLSVSGTVTANAFVGNGSGLTGLPGTPFGIVTPKCTPDGSTDNTTCLQTALSEIQDGSSHPQGRTLIIPPGNWVITSSLTSTDCTGCRIMGSGFQTKILWKGPVASNTTTSIAFQFHNWRDADIRDFVVTNYSSSYTLYSVMAFDNIGSSYVDPGHSRVSNVFGYGISGYMTNCFWLKGVQFDATSDNNNDQMTFEHCRCANYTGSAFAISHSQSLSNIFRNNQCYYGAACLAGDPDATTGTRGTFMWYAGLSAVMTTADFMIRDAQARSAIHDHTSEGAADRGIKMDSASGAITGLLVDNYEFRAGCGSTCTRYWIDWKSPGPLTVTNSTASGATLMKIDLNGSTTLGMRPNVELSNVTIQERTSGGTSMMTAADIFPSQMPQRMRGVTINDLTNNNRILDMNDNASIQKRVSASYSLGTAGESDYALSYIGVTGNSSAVTITLPNMGYFGSRFQPGKTLTVVDEGCQANTKTITVIPNSAYAGGSNSTSKLNNALTGQTITTQCGSMTITYIGSDSWVVSSKI